MSDWRGYRENLDTEHRSVGDRAYCHQDGEWCYPHRLCYCCEQVERWTNAKETNMRVGLLVRAVDKTGISGTGVVAEVAEFSDGTAVLRWLKTSPGIAPTTVVHPHIDNVIALHSHDGNTKIVWATIPEPSAGRPRYEPPPGQMVIPGLDYDEIERLKRMPT